jgi:hypothetical protein
MSLKQQKPPDVSSEQRKSNELVRLIRKLRWMGMEEEADRVQTELAQCGVRRADSVLATPHRIKAAVSRHLLVRRISLGSAHRTHRVARSGWRAASPIRPDLGFGTHSGYAAASSASAQARECCKTCLCDLHIVVPRIETCADPADDLAVDDDRKTSMHLDDVPRRDRRNPTVTDGVLQGLTGFFEQCRGSSFARCKL